MNLTRFILFLIILNLFFIGALAGMNLSKQNSLAEQRIVFNNSTINGLSPMERTKVFLFRLKKAANLTVSDLYQHWGSLCKNPNLAGIFSGAKIFVEEQLLTKNITIVQPKATTIKTGTPNYQVAEHSVNQVTSRSRLIPNYKKLTDSPASESVKGRIDPFLSLGEKFQIKTEPQVNQKKPAIETPTIIEKHKDVDNPKDELTSKIASVPAVAEIPKVTTEEKPGSKILKNCYLRGTVIGDAPTAYVEDQNGYHKLMIGDFLDEGKITAITGTSITIQIAGEEVVLKMEGLK